MKYYILPFLTMLFSAVCGAESLPFDCATPIILAPILQYMRENPDDEAQTVHVDKRPAGPKTGDNTVLRAYLMLGAAALSSLILMIRKSLE